MHISIEQALDVYDELHDAVNGVNGYGSNVAEIYVFRLLPHSPIYSMGNDEQYWDEENRIMERKAAEEFHSLCYIFAKKHEAEIKINDVSMHEWIQKVRTGEFSFSWRVYVEVNKIKK